MLSPKANQKSKESNFCPWVIPDSLQLEGWNITKSIFREKAPPKNPVICPVKVKGHLRNPFIDSWQFNSKPWGTFTCIGVKIPSQVDSEPAMTGLKTESDKADESESGLHPEGGDDRYKVGILLCWAAGRISHRGGLRRSSPWSRSQQYESLTVSR